MNRKIAISFFSISCALLFACGDEGAQNSNTPVTTPERADYRIVEGYPSRVIASIEAVDQQLEKLTRGETESRTSAIISASRTWKPGRQITVAFNGGDVSVRKRIADGVKPWSDSAKISFSFLSENGDYREWRRGDSSYTADIRIAFEKGENGGYWSAIGRDSVSRTLFPPGEASMNLEGFDDNLPEDWQDTLIHEFGHAIGFQHEHQHPNSTCEAEYRWHDDPGYVPTMDDRHQFVRDVQGRRPGIYTILSGAPNKWPRARIDFNLRKFAYSSDWLLSGFDPLSIMKYHFPSWMYRDISASTTSGCYSSPPSGLSAEDRRAALIVYPRSPNDIKEMTEERADVSREMIQRSDVSQTLKEQFKSNVR